MLLCFWPDCQCEVKNQVQIEVILLGSLWSNTSLYMRRSNPQNGRFRKAQADAKTDLERRKQYWEHVRHRRILATRILELARANPREIQCHDAVTIERELLIAICRDAANASNMDSLASEQLLREVIAKNPHRDVRGMAHFYLAELLEDRAFRINELLRHPDRAETTLGGEEEWKRLSKRGADELIEEVEKIFQHIIENYADLNTPRKRTLGELAQGRLSRSRHLTVGKPALEIEGEDIDGQRFRLSDYRGKVILLTFSGNWCGPCRAFYPKERELVGRLKDRPFVILSVNTDEDRETLKKSIASGEVTWRCWCDEGKDGPITIRCGVYYFPTVLVLDHKGVVRHEQIAGKQLDEALDMLLLEAEKENPQK